MSTPETERVRRIWEKLAPKYDKLIVSGEVAVRRRPRLGLLAGDWKRPGDRRRNGSELRALPRGRPADGNRSQRVHGWNCKENGGVARPAGGSSGRGCTGARFSAW